MKLIITEEMRFRQRVVKYAIIGKIGIRHHRTRPYSPWQNGIVERSHRIDNELFYNKRRFNSYK